MAFRLFDLNDPQRTAVTTTEGPLLILAGAGTGKTRVITARAAYLIHNGTPPEAILAVTFTNKAAKEMRERLATMIEPLRAKKVTMSTFHALCVRILRSDAERLGYKNNFAIYDEGDQMGLIKKLITRLSARDEKLDPNLAKNLISKAKNDGHSAPAEEKNLISAVFAGYQRELKTLNAMDFDDLLLQTVKLLSEHPEALEKWRKRFTHLMIDEFQDTNRLQLELIAFLARRHDGSRPNICVVGDDDQSIYGWRGAEVSNILEFEHHFPNPVVVKLEQNYRSTTAILNTANSIIKHNPRRRPKSLWSDKEGGEKVRIVQMPDDRQEAQWVAEDIHQRHVVSCEPWESFAVLFRMNAQSRLIEENLRRMQVPYRLIGGRSFFDRREIRDVLAYASTLVNPHDDVCLLRIINSPARGIGEKVVERALEHSIHQKTSLFTALSDPSFTDQLTDRSRRAIGDFFSLIDRYETSVSQPFSNPATELTALLNEIDFFPDLHRGCKTPEEGLSRETNVRDILADLDRFRQRSSEGLRGFLDEMALDRDREQDEEKEQGSGVTLITLHAAKGLEFPHVYLVGLEEGIIPHERSRMEGNVDEERRLLYVGITRAMKTLNITWCRGRMKWGSAAPCNPSTFIKDFAPENIEHVDLFKLQNTPVTEQAAKASFADMFSAIEKL